MTTPRSASLGKIAAALAPSNRELVGLALFYGLLAILLVAGIDLNAAAVALLYSAPLLAYLGRRLGLLGKAAPKRARPAAAKSASLPVAADAKLSAA